LHLFPPIGGRRCAYSSPRRCARCTASALLRTSSLRYSVLVCSLIVWGERKSSAAISRFVCPAAMRAGYTLDEIDLVVVHQANRRILRSVGERLGLDADRVVDCIELFGNTSAATIPLALWAAERDGQLVPGSRIVVAAFGAGFQWGAGVVEWTGA